MESEKFIEYDKDMYHYLRVFGNAYESGDFSKFFNLLDDNCKLGGNLVDEINGKRIKLDDVIGKHIEGKDIEGKNKIIDYFKQYEKPDFCYCEIVMLEFDLHAKGMEAKTSEGKNVRVKVFHDDKKLCLIIMSLFGESFDVHDNILVEFDINEKGLISRINISLKGLYNFRPFILPWDFSHKELGSDWYPKYEEDNIYSEQELCNIGVGCSCEMLEVRGYKVTYAQPMLSRTPNIIAEKDGKKCYCVVRGVHKKDIKRGEFDENGHLLKCLWLHNLPHKALTDIGKDYAKKEGMDYKLCLCYLHEINPKTDDGIVRRGSKRSYDIMFLDGRIIDL